VQDASRLGVKARYGVGQDTFALAQIESRLYLGNGGDSTEDKAELGTRNTFVGVENKQLGTLLLGRYDNAYKLALKAFAPTLYGNLNDAVSDYGSKQILNRLGFRQGDMLSYESPALGGFSAGLSYNFGKDALTGATDLQGQFGASLAYKQGPLSLGLGYSSLSNASWNMASSSALSAKNNPGNQSLDSVQFGGDYRFGKFSVGGVYERTASSLSSSTAVPPVAAFDQSQVTYGLTGGYRDGPLTVQVRMAKADDVDGTTVTDTGAYQLGVALRYQFHKHMAVITSLTSVQNERNASFTSFSGFSLGKGSSMTQLAVGLAVTF